MPTERSRSVRIARTEERKRAGGTGPAQLSVSHSGARVGPGADLVSRAETWTRRVLQDLYAKERTVEEELEGLLERRSDLEQGLGTLRDSSQVSQDGFRRGKASLSFSLSHSSDSPT